MTIKRDRMIRVWFFVEADMLTRDFHSDDDADGWLENYEVEEFKRESVMVERPCSCDNTQTRFYQDHGCCEHCFYL